MSTFVLAAEPSEFQHWEREHCEDLLRRLRFLEKQLAGEDLDRPSSRAVERAGNELRALAWVLSEELGYIDIREGSE